MAYDYPLVLDLAGRAVVVVGGGAVAGRKAAGVIAAGAVVSAVAPEFRSDFPQAAARTLKAYETADLAGAALVFAATDSAAVNDRVVADARAAKIWVCRADGSDTAGGDFVMPAISRQGPVTVTVSAGSAALAVSIRDEIASNYDPRWSDLAGALLVLRPWVLASGWDGERRKTALRKLASVDALSVLAGSGVDGLKRWVSDAGGGEK